MLPEAAQSSRVESVLVIASTSNSRLNVMSDSAPRPDQGNDSFSEALDFYGVDLRLSALLEMLISHRDNTLTQLTKTALWYKERALHELYPSRRSLLSLDRDMRRNVIQRAIEMAVADSSAGTPRP